MVSQVSSWVTFGVMLCGNCHSQWIRFLLMLMDYRSISIENVDERLQSSARYQANCNNIDLKIMFSKNGK